MCEISGDIIREYRKMKKLTSSQLAAMIGVTQGSISQIETGKRKASLEIMNNLIEVLEIPKQENKITHKTTINFNDVEMDVVINCIINPNRELDSFEKQLIDDGISEYIKNSKHGIEKNIKIRVQEKINQLEKMYNKQLN
ncbi:helix-turn-helix transcriptional regulator [Heyndrickxia oleronia]|uniref:helix-turn-helix domain-containing protein n=1 Tax=Heyndrickxia oleronia TaxID=38875 RepID=UPI003F247C71